jgi:hypothetical protein
MHPRNRTKLAARVIKAAEASLKERKYVAPVDVLVGVGWLDPKALERWRLGQVDYLERVVQANLARISKAMKLFRSWATARAIGPARDALQVAITHIALQQERTSEPRTHVPHPLGFTEAHPCEACARENGWAPERAL